MFGAAYFGESPFGTADTPAGNSQMSFTFSNVQGTFVNAANTPATGTVTFTLTAPIVSDGTAMQDNSIVATLDVTGSIAQPLVATTGLDAFWRVDINLVGSPERTFYINTPAGSASTPYPAVLLADLREETLPLQTVDFDAETTWNNYLTISEVLGYLNIVNLVGREQVLDNVSSAVQTWVQNYCSRPVAPTTFARRYSAWNDGKIILPFAPIIGQPVVNEYIGPALHVLSEQTPETQGDAFSYTINRRNGVVTRTTATLWAVQFMPGHRNIEITWQAGYSPIPADLRYATLEMIHYHWIQGQEAARQPAKYNAYDASSGDASGSMLWPGMPNRIANVLQNYRRFNIA